MTPETAAGLVLDGLAVATAGTRCGCGHGEADHDTLDGACVATVSLDPDGGLRCCPCPSLRPDPAFFDGDDQWLHLNVAPVLLSVRTTTPERSTTMTTTTAEHEELLTPAQVARLFRVDPKTVTRWARAGRLSSIRTLGGHRRYRAAEVHALRTTGEPEPEPVG